MPTTVVKTIGTSSRDYSTLQLWEDACPANLVTADQIWQGQAYNDSEFTTVARVLTVSGETVDATRYLELTAATGQSFQDAAGVRTNALKYNASNGVAIRSTTSYDWTVKSSVGYFRMSRVQVKNDGTTSSDVGLYGAQTGLVIKDCIFSTAVALGALLQGSGILAINLICFLRGSSGNGLQIDNGAKAIGCAVIRTTDQSPAGTGFFNAGYGTNIIQSCASFGFTTCATSGHWDTTNSKNNATDQASGFPGSTANQYGITFNSTSPFTNSTVSSQNSIPVTGTNLSANGFRDATNAPNDITGTARTATPTIGVWELVAAGGGRISRTSDLSGLGGFGQQCFNPQLG